MLATQVLWKSPLTYQYCCQWPTSQESLLLHSNGGPQLSKSYMQWLLLFYTSACTSMEILQWLSCLTTCHSLFWREPDSITRSCFGGHSFYRNSISKLSTFLDRKTRLLMPSPAVRHLSKIPSHQPEPDVHCNTSQPPLSPGELLRSFISYV